MRTLALGSLTVGIALALAAPAPAQLRLGTGKTADPLEYRPGGDAALLDHESVRKELNLSTEQLPKVMAAVQESVRLRRDTDIRLMKTPPKDVPAKQDEIWKPVNEAGAKLVKDVLTDAQRERLKQIAYQATGPDALLRVDVRGALKLTEAQMGGIDRLVAERAKEMKAGKGDSAKQLAELNGKYLRAACELLTDEQAKTWRTLTGPTFQIR
jgi:hypothetical protein